MLPSPPPDLPKKPPFAPPAHPPPIKAEHPDRLQPVKLELPARSPSARHFSISENLAQNRKGTSRSEVASDTNGSEVKIGGSDCKASTEMSNPSSSLRLENRSKQPLPPPIQPPASSPSTLFQSIRISASFTVEVVSHHATSHCREENGNGGR
ncbi:hypothetical protein BU24DRAFT_428376 [Aaosphaeria arxii CBS 175.79]|uniref:Uncharacterized protein n=1 Tax=Aaosphaeria arxii CBS 175.79 TaxID=1450172 RepID=A0A6A5X967_9PLEO|nr:uncharacterized protein BU24DRAFT_428376 [Aaosphaeria arxii CBS 175.79]KAF2009481.1 hypothetical protein BU24DRAFT_428376 [Aaosphaeria arxii CBS 175.79]